jgi:hypothetical protein
MIDEGVGFHRPSERFRHRRKSYWRRRLDQEQPGLDREKRNRLAADRAHDDAERLGWMRRHDAEMDLDAAIDERVQDLLARVEDDMLVEAITGLMDRHYDDFTDTDRSTWAWFVEADLVGAAIDWESHGVSRRAGAQRLFALLGKLRTILEDWRL